MSWVFEFSTTAESDLKNLPKAIQKRVGRALLQMTTNPFQGNVKALQGEAWKGVFRRRMGDYRLLFTVDHERSTVHIVRILLRSGTTYH